MGCTDDLLARGRHAGYLVRPDEKGEPCIFRATSNKIRGVREIPAHKGARPSRALTPLLKKGRRNSTDDTKKGPPTQYCRHKKATVFNVNFVNALELGEKTPKKCFQFLAWFAACNYPMEPCAVVIY